MSLTGIFASVNATETIQISGTSPLAGKNVIFQPYSIDQVDASGNVQTQLFTTTAGNAHVKNFWVDVPIPGFRVVDTEMIGSNETTIVYRIDAESDLPINLYTKTLATDIAYQSTTSKTWVDYLHYRWDCYACGFNVDDPGVNYNTWFSSSSSIYPNYYQHAAITYGDTFLKSGNIASSLNSGMDEYQNLKIKVGYNTPAPVTFKSASNSSIRVTFATTSWQVTGMYATTDWVAAPLGQYKTEYINVGKEQGNLDVYSTSDMLTNTKQFMTPSEQSSYYANQVAGKIGWQIAGYQNGITVQQGLNDGPTTGNALINAGNRIEEVNTINTVDLGYHIRPNVVKDEELLDVTHGRVDIRTSAPWPYGPEMTLVQPGTTETVCRNLVVQAGNSYIRQNWKSTYSFYVTVVPENIATTAFLGIPKMEQDKMVIDASIYGETDLTEYIDDASPFGDLVRGTGNLVDEILSWMWPILIIVIAFLAIIYIVPGVFKRVGQKAAGNKPT